MGSAQLSFLWCTVLRFFKAANETKNPTESLSVRGPHPTHNLRYSPLSYFGSYWNKDSRPLAQLTHSLPTFKATDWLLVLLLSATLPLPFPFTHVPTHPPNLYIMQNPDHSYLIILGQPLVKNFDFDFSWYTCSEIIYITQVFSFSFWGYCSLSSNILITKLWSASIFKGWQYVRNKMAAVLLLVITVTQCIYCYDRTMN